LPQLPFELLKTSSATVTPNAFWLKQADLTGTDGTDVTWVDAVASVTPTAITTNKPKLATFGGARYALFTAANAEGLKYANASLTTLNAALTSGEFTITILAYTTSVVASGTLLDKGGNGSFLWMLSQDAQGSASGGQRFGVWSRLATRSQALASGKPHVFTYVRTTVGSIIQERLYVDGKLDKARAALSPGANGSSAVGIGGLAAGGGSYWYSGGIGEVQVHNSALTPDQIRANANALLAQAARSYLIDPPSVAGSLNIGIIGDSINDPAFSTGGVFSSALHTYLDTVLTARLGITVNITAKGVSGATTNDWTPGTATFEAADLAFEQAGCQLVLTMLGVNDAAVSNRATSLYSGNLGRTIDEQVARGRINVVFPPIYPTSDSTNLKTKEYVAACEQIVDGVSVFGGTVRAWDNFNTDGGTGNLTTDGIHPNSGGQQVLAQMYADAIENAVRSLNWV
jgi:lysophospholipase L1-like esterase